MGGYKILKRTFNNTISYVSTNKAKLAFSLCLQLLFVLCISGIFIASSISLTEDLQKITGPLEQVSEEDLMTADQNQLLRQTALMYAGYLSLLKHIALYSLLTLSAFLIIEGWLWIIPQLQSSQQRSTQKYARVKQTLTMWRRFCERALLFIVPYVIIAILTIIIFVEKDINTFYAALTGLLLLDICAGYFMLISSSILSIKSFKQYFKTLYHIATTKLFQLLIPILITTAIISLIGYLLYLTVLVESLFVLMILLVALLIFTLVFARIYMITLIKHFQGS